MADGQHYCPHCQEYKPTFENGAGLRCQACGFPISESLPKPTNPGEAASPIVLHIDDDPGLRKIVETFLTKSGYSSLSAPDGLSGLDLAQKEKPAAVLLDVMMPDLDGYEVARRLRAIPDLKNLAIIMLTGTTDPRLNTQAFKAGADLTIRKPFDRQKLLSVLGTALQMKRTRRSP